jgi:hypothetical protein
LHPISKNLASARHFLFFGLFLVAFLGACESPKRAAPAPPDATKVSAQCPKPGTLNAALFGSIETEIAWSASDMTCDSMRRPNGEGLRLRFAGKVADELLAFIIAIPQLSQGEAALELPSNITATVEGSGRFFSSADLNSCWTDIHSQTPSATTPGRFIMAGTLYCVRPLGEVNGDAAVSIPELSFTTTVEW